MARHMSWGPSNPLYVWQKKQAGRYKHVAAGAKYVRRKVTTMARRYRSGRRRSRGGFGMGRLLSMKNILFTLGGAYVGAKVLNLDPKIAAAAGGFLGAGPVGAVAGYVAGPMVLGMIPGVGMSSSSSNGTGAW